MAVFCNTTPHSLVDAVSEYTDDGGSKLLWNISQHLPDYTVQLPEDRHVNTDHCENTNLSNLVVS
jgi:hypothetical protein